MSEEGIRLIVGLGNPGPQYEDTRHNAGFWFADRVAAAAGGSFRAESKFHGMTCRISVGGAEVRLLKPTTYMNHSGQSVAALVRYFDIAPEQILIAYDELDLPAGTVRVKRGGGHAGHNGMRDSIAALGTREFWRLRIGIGHPGDKAQVVGRPSKADGEAIHDAIDDAERSLSDLVAGKFQLVMNRLHAGP